MDFSNLRPFIGDAADGSKALVLEGFDSEQEVSAFMDALLAAGIVRPRDDQAKQ